MSITSVGIFMCSVALLLFVAMWRNDWTYKKRVWLIHNDHDAYERLPSYNTVFLKFWVWDIYKFCSEKKTVVKP